MKINKASREKGIVLAVLLSLCGCSATQVPQDTFFEDVDRLIAHLKSDEGFAQAQDREGLSALHRAASVGNNEAVVLLVAHNANVNLRDGDGQTPLHLAARQGFKQIVEILVAQGANVNLRDKKGESPLQAATEWGYEDLAVFLRAHNAVDPVGKVALKTKNLSLSEPVVSSLPVLQAPTREAAKLLAPPPIVNSCGCGGAK